MEILIENKTGRIHYGFGADYLPNWGIPQALREVYQNFIDYGEYSEEVVTTSDLSFSDTLYIDRVPEDIKSSFKPRLVGNNIEFTYKNDKKVDQVVKNSNIADALKNDSFFAAAIKKLKRFVAKQLGLYELLVEFKQKHVHTSEALQDFDLILSRVKK